MQVIETFQDLLDDAYLITLEHNMRMDDFLDEAPGLDGGVLVIDMDLGLLTFSGSPSLDVTAHFIGSAAPGPWSWLWGWTNMNGYPDAAVALAHQIREFGECSGIDELATAELPLVEDPLSDAGLSATAACLISGGMPCFVFESDGGTMIALLLESEHFALKPPSALRALTTLQTALMGGVVNDWQRAIESYAAQRGLGFTRSSPTKLSLSAPGGMVELTLDERGNLARIETILRAGQRPTR